MSSVAITTVAIIGTLVRLNETCTPLAVAAESGASAPEPPGPVDMLPPAWKAASAHGFSFSPLANHEIMIALSLEAETPQPQPMPPTTKGSWTIPIIWQLWLAGKLKIGMQDDSPWAGIAMSLAALFVWGMLNAIKGAPSPHIAVRRAKFVALEWVRDILSVAGRFLVMKAALGKSSTYWALMWPLIVLDTTSVQVIADLYEGRPLKLPGMHAVKRMLVLSFAVAVSICTGVYGHSPSYGPFHPGVYHIPLDGPTATSLLAAVWRVPLFDLGLDLGFYMFHRGCHTNRTLYRLVHAEHHTDTGKVHGHLVAWETWDISLIETFSIALSYAFGLALLHVAGVALTLFDLAFLISWAHLVETLGHTAMTWTVPHPFRVPFDVMGVALSVDDHTMHHVKPLSNYGKRSSLFDRLSGTYSPPIGRQPENSRGCSQ